MSKVVRIEFSTGNAAFNGDNLHHEISAVLDRAKIKIASGFDANVGRTIHDSNGNSIGDIEIYSE